MGKSIIISVHDITNNKMLGYISGFSAYGGLSIDVDIKDALIFKNKEIAELYFPDGMQKEIGRIDIIEKYSHEETDMECPNDNYGKANQIEIKI